MDIKIYILVTQIWNIKKIIVLSMYITYLQIFKCHVLIFIYLYDRIKIDVILPARIDDKLSFDNSFSLIYQQRRLRNGNTI